MAFHSNRDGKAQMFVMDADGKNQKSITSLEYDNYMGAISPDGSEIIYTSNRTGNHELFKCNIDGSNEIQLTIGVSINKKN